MAFTDEEASSAILDYLAHVADEIKAGRCPDGMILIHSTATGFRFYGMARGSLAAAKPAIRAALSDFGTIISDSAKTPVH